MSNEDNRSDKTIAVTLLLSLVGVIVGYVFTAPMGVILEPFIGALFVLTLLGTLVGVIIGFSLFINTSDSILLTGFFGAFVGAILGTILGIFVGFVLIIIVAGGSVSIVLALVGVTIGIISRDGLLSRFRWIILGAIFACIFGAMVAGNQKITRGIIFGAGMGLVIGAIITSILPWLLNSGTGETSRNSKVSQKMKEMERHLREEGERRRHEEEVRQLRKEREQRKIAALKDEILSLIKDVTSDRGTETRSADDLKSEKLARGGSN